MAGTNASDRVNAYSARCCNKNHKPQGDAVEELVMSTTRILQHKKKKKKDMSKI